MDGFCSNAVIVQQQLCLVSFIIITKVALTTMSRFADNIGLLCMVCVVCVAGICVSFTTVSVFKRCELSDGNKLEY